LDLYTSVDGERTDAAVVEYAIFELVTNPLVPAQVFPLAGREAADVEQFCSDGGNRLGLGHYLAKWDVPIDEPIGTHAINWWFKLDALGEEFSFVEAFDIVPLVGSSDASLYTTIEEMRARGVTTTLADDATLLASIELNSRMIDHYTGQWFYAREMELRLDGRGTTTMHLDAPIVEITSVAVDYWADNDEPTEIALTDLEIYDRHVRLGQLKPDDRQCPKIVLRLTTDTAHRVVPGWGGVFPKGKQNVLIIGSFGYVEPDRSTPLLIREVCRRMVKKDLLAMAAGGSGGASGPVKREKTREQEIEYADANKSALQGVYTGDPAIDMILVRYRRPPSIGAV
jgi:hypothetical protein